MNPFVVGFLQNAYSPLYAGTIWPYDLWLDALERSRSGVRLQRLIDATDNIIDFYFDNTTPEVAENPDDKLTPDVAHINKVLTKYNPKIVLALGNQAASALIPIWHGNLLWLPHPASRTVTNKLYKAAGRLLKKGFEGRYRIKQLEGRYIKSKISKAKLVNS